MAAAGGQRLFDDEDHGEPLLRTRSYTAATAASPLWIVGESDADTQRSQSAALATERGTAAACSTVPCDKDRQSVSHKPDSAASAAQGNVGGQDSSDSGKPAASDSADGAVTQHPTNRTLRHPISLLFFLWVNPLIELGKKKVVGPGDLFDLEHDDRSSVLADRLERGWASALAAHGCAADEERSWGGWVMFSAVRRAFGREYSLLVFFIVVESSLALAIAYFVGRVVLGLQEEDTDSGNDNQLYTSTALLIAFSFFRSVILHNTFFRAYCLGMKLRAASVGLLFRKTLLTSQTALARVTVGHVINLVSNDVERFVEICIFSYYLFVGPLLFVGVLWLSWLQIGEAVLAGGGVILLTIAAITMSSRRFSVIRKKTAVRTDERVKTTGEMLQGMRVLKMYGWEEPFSDIVNEQRSAELSYVIRSNFLRGCNAIFFSTFMNITSFASFLVYELQGNTLTAEKVFSVLALFGSLRLPFGFCFPNAILALSELRVTLQRMEALMRLPEVAPRAIPAGMAKGSVLVDKLSFTWSETGRPALQNLTFSVEPGSLLAIVGPVGAGKSTLLNCLLGELQPTSGSCAVSGKVAYASQESWILSCSVKDNILFGAPYEEAWFEQVLDACALRQDIESFAHGIETLVGERGIMLSGGQKARLSLARAVYSNADVYLLDDPLSAVDAIVGSTLFHQCLAGPVTAGRTRIMTTHQVQFARLADRILLLGEDGVVVGAGSYDELLAAGHDLEAWHQLHGQSEAEADADSKSAAKETKLATSTSVSTSVLPAAEPAPPATVTVASATKDTHKDAKKNERQQQLAETRNTGEVTWRTYYDYASAAGGFWVKTALAMLFLLAQGAQILTDWFLSYWTDLAPEERQEDRNLLIYSALVAAVLIFAIGRSFYFMICARNASQTLHDRAFSRLLATDLRFFDLRPIGQILNRFSKDFGYLDDLLPWTLLDLLLQSVAVVSIAIFVSSLNPWLFLFLVPVVACFFYVRHNYVQSAREIKRIEAVERSPVYAHISTCLAGLSTLRAYDDAPARFRREFVRFHDAHGRAYFAFVAVSRWLGVRLDVLASGFVAAVAVGVVLARDQLSPSEAGVSLALVLQLTASMQRCARQSAEVENQMTACERVLEYTHLPPEEDYLLSMEEEPASHIEAHPRSVLVDPSSSWPEQGAIEFRDLSLRFATELPLVLQHVSCTIRPREKIGIVGRTGAGKSSLLAALFRLAPRTGQILIDGVDTATVPKLRLRRALSVIPQDPVLYSATVRKNLDPFGRHSNDAVLWDALTNVALASAVRALPGQLEYCITEGGANFSVGQRQLICLARAIISAAHILVLDEATADVDLVTDKFIQETLRARFADTTVLTIAHRLDTILDYDRIMVLDAGRLVEFGTPDELMSSRGHFYELVSKRS
eukprot:m.92564 g.92564  ORF g.92564 m.92564 type:complete len:1403 (-) comp8653_c0_seq4:26-4234(-)